MPSPFPGMDRYRPDPVPPLDPANAAWSEELLRSNGLR